MKKFLSRIILALLGWKITGSWPEGLKKAVIIAAPHTSYMDFIIGHAGLTKLGVKKIKFLIKREMFLFPLGPALRFLGAMPVDRDGKTNTLHIVSKMFEENEILALTMTPEGTRKYNEHWKKGFYHIAISAKVPIVLSYIDYAKKEGGIGKVLYPSGDYDKDFQLITEFYSGMTARYPEKFNLTVKKKLEV